NQSRLQSHVALNNLEVLRKFRWKFASVISEVSRRYQRWCQRRAQFVAQGREKVIFRFARFFRHEFGSFTFAAANLIREATRDLGESAKAASTIAQRRYHNFGMKN